MWKKIIGFDFEKLSNFNTFLIWFSEILWGGDINPIYLIFFVTVPVFQVLFSEIVYGGGKSGTSISSDIDQKIPMNSALISSNNRAILKECNLGDSKSLIWFNITIEGIPNKVFGNIIYFTDEDSFIRIIDDKYESFPDELELESKIKNIEISDKPYIIEAIVLQSPNTSEITTKSGENVTVSDTLIGDDTGEIRLTGWREQSRLISKLVVGNRIKVIGAVAGIGRENKIEITLKGFSEIRKIN